MLKLNVGLSRKVGEANYGSRGASVNLELEVESALAAEPAQLQDRIRQLYRLARAAVDEELGLAGQQPASGHANGHASGNGHARSGTNGSSTNGSRSRAARYATASQVRALHAIAEEHGLDLVSQMEPFNVVRPEDLSIRQASELIDHLKLAGGVRR